MENKDIVFNVYRYQLVPIENGENTILKGFDEEKKISYEDLKEQKNELFKKALFEISDNPTEKNILKIIDNDEEFFLLKLSNKKFESIVDEKLKESLFPSHPYCYVVINNNPEIQKIFISVNSDAFSTSNFSKTVLIKLLRKQLEKYSLNILSENIFDEFEFWKIIEKNSKKITSIDFEIIKPNIANISGSLKDVLKETIHNHNSHKTNLSLQAPKNGILKNINKESKDISGIVEYASEGGGNISVKVIGDRKKIKTKQQHKVIKIDEKSLLGGTLKVIKGFYDNLLK